MKNAILKKCPSCGRFFGCQGEDDCWCENYQIHKTGYLRISENFTECICQDCLAEFAEK